MEVRYFKWVPVVDRARCTGCARCVEACGPKSLELENRVAILALPDTCGSEGHCISPCPENAIQMRWMELDGEKAVGKWQADVSFETMPGTMPRAGREISSARRLHARKVCQTDDALSR